MRLRSSLLALLLTTLVLLAAGCDGPRARTPAVENAGPEHVSDAPTPAVGGGSEPAEGEDEDDVGSSLLALTYVDPETGLSVGIPGDWAAYETEDAVVVMVSPQVGEDDIFLENVVVTADDHFPDPTLDVYVEAMEAEVRNRYPDTETLESGDIVVSGVPGRWMVDRFTAPKGEARVYRTVLVREGIAYVIHGTALAPTFDKYRPIFEAVVRSVTWVEPDAGSGDAEGGG
ncbi:MAG: hypothetical protein AB2385_03210 [Symbiobacterium sp.]|uniref:hypothetical protein n=1 Tax=Symbiobacterium sp. TaxID=1971213 RepID=UPI0034647AE6